MDYAVELLAEIAAGVAEVMLKRYDEICQIHDRLKLKDFEPAKVNRRLQRYRAGDRRWMYEEECADVVQSSASH